MFDPISEALHRVLVEEKWSLEVMLRESGKLNDTEKLPSSAGEKEMTVKKMLKNKIHTVKNKV